MEKKFVSEKKRIAFLFFLGFLLNTSYNILIAQDEGTAPKLTIIKANLGIFDNKIKHGEFVAFKNSPGIWRDNTYAAAYTNWLEQQDGDVWFKLNNPNFNNKHEVFKIEKIFPTVPQLKEKYEYAKGQFAGMYPEYKDDIVKEIFEKIKNGDFKNVIKKGDLKSGVWPELPFDENDFVTKIDENPNLSKFKKEQYKRTTFVHQYLIRNYEIKEGDQIQLRVLPGGLMGLTHMYWWAIPLDGNWTWMPKILDNPSDSTNWKLTKVNGVGQYIENLSKICIESLCPNLEGRRIQRFGIIANTERAVIRPQGQEYPNYAFGVPPIKENAYFDIYRLGPETKRLDFNDKNSPKLDVTSKLNVLISKPDGLSQISDGITFPREGVKPREDVEQYNWKSYFGNPVSDSTKMSNLWLQLNVTYTLGRRTYTHTYNEWEENIQIPTQKELEEATNDLKGLQQAQTNIEKLGFVKIPGRLTRIFVKGKQVIGDKASGTVQWNYDKKDWQPYKGPLLNFLMSPLGTRAGDQDIIWEIKDGMVFKSVKGIRNQFVKNKRMTYVATSSDKTTYALDKDGNIFRWTGEDKFNSDDVWEQISGPKLKQISVGSEKYICGIDKSGKVWKWNGFEFEEETLISDAAQIEINNLGEIWLLVKEVQASDYAVYYYAKNVWALNDKFSLHSKASSKAGYLINLSETPTPAGETNLQSGIDQNTLWSAVNPEDPNDNGPLNYGATIILKSPDNKFISSDKDNNLIATPNINQSTRFMLINQPRPSSRDEISRDIETPILLKSGKKYLSVSNKQAILSEKDSPGLSERWVIEEY